MLYGVEYNERAALLYGNVFEFYKKSELRSQKVRQRFKLNHAVLLSHYTTHRSLTLPPTSTHRSRRVNIREVETFYFLDFYKKTERR
jgi:hypothetical protein